MKRLLELKQELDKLSQFEEELEGDSITSWEVLQTRAMVLQMEMSHEELVQMTSLLNVLNAMQLNTIAELVGLQRQIDDLSELVDGLQALQDEKHLSHQDHIDKVFEGKEFLIEEDIPTVAESETLRKTFDFSTTPHKG